MICAYKVSNIVLFLFNEIQVKLMRCDAIHMHYNAVNTTHNNIVRLMQCDAIHMHYNVVKYNT